MLIESNGYQMDNADERDLFEAVGNLYEAPAEIRRIRSLMGYGAQAARRTSSSSGLRMVKYGALFDKVEDYLTFARFQAFDFEGMGEEVP